MIKAKEVLGGSDKLYFRMLESFEDLTLIPVLKSIIAPFD
jgi:hypothetical protein